MVGNPSTTTTIEDPDDYNRTISNSSGIFKRILASVYRRTAKIVNWSKPVISKRNDPDDDSRTENSVPTILPNRIVDNPAQNDEVLV